MINAIYYMIDIYIYMYVCVIYALDTFVVVVYCSCTVCLGADDISLMGLRPLFSDQL